MQKKYVALILGLMLVLPLNIYADEGGEVGDTPPNFTLPDIKGNTHTLYDYLNNPAVLVYFWNYRGCGHPQGKLDSLQKRLYNAYHSQGLEILAINCGDGKEVTQYWADAFNITFPMLYVEGAEMEALLEAYEIPVAPDLKSMTDELIDPSDTTIYYRARPPFSRGTGLLEPKVKELIAKNAVPDIEVEPETLAFDLSGSDSETKGFFIKNRGWKDLEVKNIKTDVSWIENISSTNFSVSPSDSEEVEVIVNPEGLETGEYTGTISILSNDPDEDSVSVQVILHYITGIQEKPLSKSFWFSHKGSELRLYLSKPLDISLTLFNAIGCLIQRRNLGLLSAGEHSVQWSSKDFAPGVYFLCIKAGDLSEVQKMVIIK